jgi:hypothetical protein
MQKLKLAHKRQDLYAAEAHIPTVRATKSEIAAIKQYLKDRAAGKRMISHEDLVRELGARARRRVQ